MLFELDEIRFFSSRMPPIPHWYQKGKMAAKLKFDGDGDVDTVAELEDAIEDIDNAIDNTSSKGYDDKIKKSLLAQSVETEDYDKAKLEWSLHKKWADPNGGQCELCGHHPIVYHFQIKNKHNHNKLIVGSECIYNYVTIEGYTKEQLAKYLNRLRQRLKDRRFNAVEQELLDIWDKQDEVYDSLKKLVAKLPAGFRIDQFWRQLWRFDQVRDFDLKEAYKKYVANVRTMSRMLERTYGEMELVKIPDKIQRKRKINGQEVTDQKKLELFIEFETELKLLLKFGKPSEAYDLILEDFKDFLRGKKDEIDAKKDKAIAEISDHFGDMKRRVGSRSRIKDYIDSWCDRVQAKCKEQWTDYEAYLNDIDGIMSGRTRVPREPPADAKVYVNTELGSYNSWSGATVNEQYLYKLVTQDKPTATYVAPSWSSNIPSDSPLRKVTSIDGGTLYAALMDSVDAEEVPLVDLTQVMRWGSMQVSADFINNHPGLMKRVMADSPEVRKAIEEAAEAAKSELERKKKEEAAAEAAAEAEKAQRAADEQEYTDILENAEKYKEPGNDWEDKFVKDMRKYKVVGDLSPRQLYYLKRIADRSTVPQPTPAQNAAVQQQQAPAGGTSIAFNDFLEDCKTTARAGREPGFINSIQRQYKSWSQVSPRQGQWLMKIYLRGAGRTKPDHIS